MTTIEILNDWISRKIAYGSRNFNLDDELKELFGPSQLCIETNDYQLSIYTSRRGW